MHIEAVLDYLHIAVSHPDRVLMAAYAELTGTAIPITFPMSGESHPVAGVLPDLVSRYMYLRNERREYEPETAQMLRAHIGPGDTVFVIGAHIGVHAILAKQRVGSAGKVVAFEPSPDTYTLLKDNCSTRDIVAEHMAISSGARQLDMTIFDTRHSAWNCRGGARDKAAGSWSPRKISVPATSIDAYCEENGLHPKMLLLDLENSEKEALVGAAHTIQRLHPKIIIECGDLGRSEENSTHACLTFLKNFDYQLWEIDPHSGLQKEHVIQSSYPDYFPNLLATHDQG